MSIGARLGGVLLGLVILAAPAGMLAAEAPAAKAPAGKVPVLNLSQLTEMALKFSPEVKATESEVTLAKEQKNEVHGYLFPQFDTTITGGVIPNARVPIVQSVGNQLLVPDPKDKLHGVNVFGHLDFTLTQPLYTFGKIKYRERATEKNIKVKKEGVVAKQGEVMVLVAQAYYGLILANQGKEAVKEARSYLSDTKERINRLEAARSPNVKETDKYRLAAYEGAIEKSGAEAEEGAKTAYRALQALTGQGNRDFQVPTDLPNPICPRRGFGLLRPHRPGYAPGIPAVERRSGGPAIVGGRRQGRPAALLFLCGGGATVRRPGPQLQP